MNKRGQERLSVLETIGVVLLVVVGVALLVYVYVDTGKSAKALTGQLPDDVAAISGACKLAAQSGQSFLDGAYCTQAREVSYKGLLGFIGGSKAFVNCEFAYDNKWFALDAGKAVPSRCNSEWAVGYCNYLKSVQGAKYKDSVVVNGQTCLAKGVQGTSSKVDDRSCSQLEGDLITNAEPCPNQAKQTRLSQGFTESNSAQICCVK